jgi:hypothetical protein
MSQNTAKSRQELTPTPLTLKAYFRLGGVTIRTGGYTSSERWLVSCMGSMRAKPIAP